MKLLNLTGKAYDKYRLSVKGNGNIAYDQAQKKLTRNVVLVKETIERKPYEKKRFMSRSLRGVTYHYGNLDITVRFGKIVDIENNKGQPVKWSFPRERYQQLNKELGILDCKYKNRLKDKQKLKFYV